MPAERKLTAPITLFAAIEAKQHDALRTIAFEERRSIADVVRQALDEMLSRPRRRKTVVRRARPRTVKTRATRKTIRRRKS